LIFWKDDLSLSSKLLSGATHLAVYEVLLGKMPLMGSITLLFIYYFVSMETFETKEIHEDDIPYTSDWGYDLFE